MSGKQSSHTSREIGAARKTGWSSVRCRCGQTIKSKSVTTRRVSNHINSRSGNRSCENRSVFYIFPLCRTYSTFGYCKLCSAFWLGRKDLNPRNGGVRVHCLTTWRRPNNLTKIIIPQFSHFVKCFLYFFQKYYSLFFNIHTFYFKKVLDK